MSVVKDIVFCFSDTISILLSANMIYKTIEGSWTKEKIGNFKSNFIFTIGVILLATAVFLLALGITELFHIA